MIGVRRKTPLALNMIAASPIGDRVEYKRAWDRVKMAFPDAPEPLGYIGTDGVSHYFRHTGDPLNYVVPITRGWRKT